MQKPSVFGDGLPSYDQVVAHAKSISHHTTLIIAASNESEGNNLLQNQLHNLSDLNEQLPNYKDLSIDELHWSKMSENDIKKTLQHFERHYSSKLHELCEFGDFFEVEKLVDEITLRFKNDLNVLDRLLDSLVDHENPCNYWRTPFLEACISGNVQLVDFLVRDMGCDIFRTDFELESSAVHLAARGGYLEIVDYLLTIEPNFLEAQNRNNGTPLCRAVLGGHLQLVEYLCSVRGANVEARGFLGRTPLHSAAALGHFQIVQFLVERARADILARDASTEASTALHLAVKYGQFDVVDYLLSVEPSLLETRDNFNDTPLCCAAANGKARIVSFLVSTKGADKEARGSKGRTPLLQATSSGSLPVVIFLVEKAKADMLAKDDDRQATVLHLAAADGHQSLVEYLLAKCPQLYDVKDVTGKRPIERAKKLGKTDVFQWLLAKTNSYSVP